MRKSFPHMALITLWVSMMAVSGLCESVDDPLPPESILPASELPAAEQRDREELIELLIQASRKEYAREDHKQLRRGIQSILRRYHPDPDRSRVLSSSYGVDFNGLPARTRERARLYYNLLDRLQINFHASPSPLDRSINSYIVGRPVRVLRGSGEALPVVIYEQAAPSYEDLKGARVLGANFLYVIEINLGNIRKLEQAQERRLQEIARKIGLADPSPEKMAGLSLLELCDLRSFQQLSSDAESGKTHADLYVESMLESVIVHERAEQRRPERLAWEQRIKMEQRSLLSELANPGLGFHVFAEFLRLEDHPGAHGKAAAAILGQMESSGLDRQSMRKMLIQDPQSFRPAVIEFAQQALQSNGQAFPHRAK